MMRGRLGALARRPAAAVALALGLLLLAAPLALAVRDTKLYDVLGVAADADDRTLKKAYKRQAL
jgi:hypothetical protein